jgi:hypothetical protein
MEEATSDGHSMPDDPWEQSFVSSLETPVKHVCPRPMSEQLLGRRPKGMHEDEGGTFFVCFVTGF